MYTFPPPGLPGLPPATEGFTFCFASASLPVGVTFRIEDGGGTIYGPVPIPVPGPDQSITVPFPPVNGTLVRCMVDFGPGRVIEMWSNPIPPGSFIAYAVYGIRDAYQGMGDPPVVPFGVDILTDGTMQSI